jgi:hypothetical protein
VAARITAQVSDELDDRVHDRISVGGSDQIVHAEIGTPGGGDTATGDDGDLGQLSSHICHKKSAGASRGPDGGGPDGVDEQHPVRVEDLREQLSCDRLVVVGGQNRPAGDHDRTGRQRPVVTTQKVSQERCQFSGIADTAAPDQSGRTGQITADRGGM